MRMRNYNVNWAVVTFTVTIIIALAAGATRAESNVSISAGDWNDEAIWSLGRPPLAGDDVTVANDLVVGQTTDHLRSFTISNATLTFTNWSTALVADEVNVNAYGLLTCAGPFTNAPAMSNRVWIVCSNVTVAANGKIDVDGKGYAGGLAWNESGSGPGAGIFVDWNPLTSGGYGGRGGFTGGFEPAGGDVYGSAEWPEQPGSGGTAGKTTPMGGAGGGAVRIEASDTVTIDGILTACGKQGAAYTASGSGGGVLITGRVICGSGSILANGGEKGYSGDAGGGGRIALHYEPVDQQALTVRPTLTVSAASGTLYPNWNSVCEFGSLWFSDRSFFGVSSVANVRGWLHIAGFTNWSVPTLALTNAFVGFTEPGFTLEVTNDVTVAGSGAIAFAPGATVTIGGDCQVGVQLTDGHLEVAGDLKIPKMTTDNFQCRFSETDVLVGGDIVLSNTWAFTSAPSNGLRVCGSLIEAGGLMQFGGASTLYLASNPTNGGAPLLRSHDFVLNTGASINAVGFGFGGGPIGQPGYGPGGGKCLNYGGGGGYGGRGGGTEASHGVSNGLAYAPQHPGSGGGAYSTVGNPGAAGGGLVHIEAANSATINGAILADGIPAYYGGAGSGGGIFIQTRRFAGGAAATMRANGGSHKDLTDGKRGGGGRICVWYGEMPENMAELLLSGRHQEIGERLMATTTFPGFEDATYAGTAEALAGIVHKTGLAGEEDGTLFFVRILPPAGTIILLR